MQSSGKGEWSGITQVKVLSPEICLVALGEEVLYSEASIAARGNGERDSGVPGSKAMAGHSMVHSGTWESHIAPEEASNEPKRRRRKYGGMAAYARDFVQIDESLEGSALGLMVLEGSAIR